MNYEKWSPGYWLLKQYVRIADWFVLKRTVIVGRHKIPASKPVIFAPNHQNALSDPMAVLLNTPYQPVWLARADIFGKSKVIDSILRFLKIVPVFRMRDGKENLGKNEQTFEISVKVLENNSALALFPEAAHSAKRQMLVHKKAVPRIAFLAEEKTNHTLDIQIIPTGIYYSHYWKFNRSVIICFGEPVPVSGYRELYRQNPNAAVMALKTKINDAMMPLVLNIASRKHYDEFEQIREMYGRHYLKRREGKISVLNLFKSDQLLVSRLDEHEHTNPEETEQLANEAARLYSKIRVLGLRSHLLEGNQMHLARIAGNFLLMASTLPIFLFGLLFNAMPFFLIDRVVRTKVRDKSFWSTFFLVAGIIIFPLFYLLEFLAVAWLIPGIWLKVLFLAAIPFAGKFAFNWYILLRKTIGRIRLLHLKWFRRKDYHQLIYEKRQLFEKLDSIVGTPEA